MKAFGPLRVLFPPHGAPDTESFGILIRIPDRLVQFTKASAPMEVTESGMLMLVRLEQLLKA